MNSFYVKPFSALLAACIGIMMTVDASAQIKTLGIGPVTTSKALLDQADREGRRADLERVTQALDSQLTSILTQTRKFKVAARTDLETITEEQALSGGGVAGLDYLVIPTVDDFQNIVKTATFAAIDKTVTRRELRLSMALKLYDTQDGILVEAPSVLCQKSIVDENPEFAQTEGDFTESLLRDMAREASLKATREILDALYPARVLAKTGSQLTINRGAGTGIEMGQVWSVYSLGETLRDPDTGEVLGSEEILVGKVRITQVDAKVSKAQTVEDRGIVIQSVLRMQEEDSDK